jgi:acyl-CoA thioester hydrolase
MSNSFVKSIEVRWSDLDPNYHVRHSVYYDYGAYCRIRFLNSHGVTAGFFAQHHFGPILFREECIFRREIKLDDAVMIDLQLVKSRSDYSRWTIQHTITRNNEHAATLVMDGAWIDTLQRKLTIPPQLAQTCFEKMPKTEQFEWIK